MKSRAWVGAAVGVAAVALMAPTAPATAAASSYVALGDSYSSGTGTRTYLNDGTQCQRSVYAYPSLIASSKGYALNFRACSGATTGSVTASQLSALSNTTAYVSITVGGNDAGFSSVITECAKPAWLSNCYAAIQKAQNVIDYTLPGLLNTLYDAIRSKAANAKVVVAGYPRLFNGTDCNAGTWFSANEMLQLNVTADKLNTTIKTAASRPGFFFSNPTFAFTGHAICSSTEWLNGLSYPVSESYHPNRLGHSSGYTPLVGPLLTGGPVTLSATSLQVAVSSADRLAAQQRAYSAADRQIRPERFVLPDLHSAAARAAAARAGVNLNDRASIDAADRRYDAAQSRGR